MNIASLFFQTARKSPDEPALADGKEALSFAEFERLVSATAAEFKSKGIQPGDRVLVFVPMSIDLYRVVMALFQIGATAVFLDEWVSLERLRVCCGMADCKGFIAPWQYRLIGFFIPEIRKIPLHFGLQRPEYQGDVEIYAAKPDDVALLTFTTGSTGTPKAARRTHVFLKHQFDALIAEIKPRPGDVVMTNLPIVMLVNFGTGSCSVIGRFNAKKPHKFKPEATVEAIKHHGVNVLIGSPFFLLKMASFSGSVGLPLEKIFTGGGPVLPEEAQLLLTTFPNAETRIVYGSTEAEPIATVEAEQLAMEGVGQKGGLCVGAVYGGTALRIIPIHNGPLEAQHLEAISLPVGEIGEIVVAGDHVLREYWNNQEAFRQNKVVTADGTVWHRTGDAGFLGKNNTLYLTGRCNQMIATKDGWISPLVVESAMRNARYVKSGALLEKDGRRVLIVQPTKMADAIHLPKEFNGQLPFGANCMILITEMPLDPRHNTKIDYARLAQWLDKQSLDDD